MVRDFFKDLNKAKEAESIVAQSLFEVGYDVKDVSNDRAYYHKGDLIITLPSGIERCVEVKCDSRIADT